MIWDATTLLWRYCNLLYMPTIMMYAQFGNVNLHPSELIGTIIRLAQCQWGNLIWYRQMYWINPTKMWWYYYNILKHSRTMCLFMGNNVTVISNKLNWYRKSDSIFMTNHTMQNKPLAMLYTHPSPYHHHHDTNHEDVSHDMETLSA